MSVHYIESKSGQPTIRIETSVQSTVKEIKTNMITLEFPVVATVTKADGAQPIIDWERFNQVNYIR